MTEEKYTAEQLEQMADQLLQEAAPAQEKPAKGGLDEKTIASLPAAALLNGNEKLRDLFTKGKKKGKLDAGELSDVLDELDLESEQMDSIYDSLEQLGIEVGSEDFLADLPDEDGEPAMDEIAEIEEEELVDPNTLVDSFNIDGDRQGAPADRRSGGGAGHRYVRRPRGRGACGAGRGGRRDHP